MSVGQDLEIPIWPKKNLMLELFFSGYVGRLQTLLLKNHVVREVGPFPMSCHICIIIYVTPKRFEWLFSGDLPFQTLTVDFS